MMKVIPVFNTIILPDVQYNLEPDILSETEKDAIREGDEVIILPMKDADDRDKITADDFFDIGLLGTVKEIRRDEDELGIAVRTDKRIKTVGLKVSADSITSDYIIIEDVDDMSESEKKASFNIVLKTLADIAAHFQWGNWAMNFTEKLDNIGEIMSIVGPYADLSVEERYDMLATDSVRERTNLIIKAMKKYKDMVDIQAGISRKIQDEQGSMYKQNLIKREISLLQEELDSMDPDSMSDIEMFEKKIKETEFPPEAKKEVDRVMRHLKQGGEDDHEYGSN